jgi:hypothetical protein
MAFLTGLTRYRDGLNRNSEDFQNLVKKIEADVVRKSAEKVRIDNSSGCGSLSSASRSDVPKQSIPNAKTSVEHANSQTKIQISSDSSAPGAAIISKRTRVSIGRRALGESATSAWSVASSQGIDSSDQQRLAQSDSRHKLNLSPPNPTTSLHTKDTIAKDPITNVLARSARSDQSEHPSPQLSVQHRSTSQHSSQQSQQKSHQQSRHHAATLQRLLFKFSELKSKTGVRMVWPHVVDGHGAFSSVEIAELIWAYSAVNDVRVESTDLRRLVSGIKPEELE